MDAGSRSASAPTQRVTLNSMTDGSQLLFGEGDPVFIDNEWAEALSDELEVDPEAVEELDEQTEPTCETPENGDPVAEPDEGCSGPGVTVRSSSTRCATTPTGLRRAVDRRGRARGPRFRRARHHRRRAGRAGGAAAEVERSDSATRCPTATAVAPGQRDRGGRPRRQNPRRSSPRSRPRSSRAAPSRTTSWPPRTTPTAMCSAWSGPRGVDATGGAVETVATSPSRPGTQPGESSPLRRGRRTRGRADRCLRCRSWSGGRTRHPTPATTPAPASPGARS